MGCPGRVAVLEFEALQAGCRLNQTIIGAADRSLLDRLTQDSEHSVATEEPLTEYGYGDFLVGK